MVSIAGLGMDFGTPSENLYVEGLPQDITDDSLKAIFMQYGTVASCKALDPLPGKPERVGLLRMSSVAEATWICHNINANIPAGLSSPVTVQFSKRANGATLASQSAAALGTMPAPSSGGTGGIQVGVMLSGTVKRWDSQKGFGFIVPDGGGPDVFVHVKELADGEVLVNGAQVMFEAMLDAAKGPGRYRAKTCMGALAKDSVGGTAASSDRLFMTGLPLEITEEQITTIFNQYGTVLSVKKLPTQDGKNDAAALVRMSDTAQAQWLIDNVHNNIPAGLETPVQIAYAENKPGIGKGYAGGPTPQTGMAAANYGKALGGFASPLGLNAAAAGPYGAPLGGAGLVGNNAAQLAALASALGQFAPQAGASPLGTAGLSFGGLSAFGAGTFGGALGATAALTATPSLTSATTALPGVTTALPGATLGLPGATPTPSPLQAGAADQQLNALLGIGATYAAAPTITNAGAALLTGSTVAMPVPDLSANSASLNGSVPSAV